MAKEFYRVHIRKEALKFAAAHMTVFADGAKEPLHGHNYQVSVSLDLTDASLANMVGFADYKKILSSLCEELDEKTLIQASCPFYKVVNDSPDSLEFTMCGKRYVLPKGETVLLPIENISTELLAGHLGRKFTQALGPTLKGKLVKRVELKVEESKGQGASWIWSNPALLD